MNGHRSRFFVGLLALGLAACAGPPQKRALPAFGSVEVVTDQVYTVGNEAHTAGRGAAKGAAGGAAVGALQGGMTGFLCGPLFFACVPAMMGIGAATGAVVGGAFGSMEALDGEEAEAINAAMAEASAGLDVNESLRVLLDAALQDLPTDRDGPRATAGVRIIDIAFLKDAEDRIRVRIAASLSLTWPGAELELDQWTAEKAATSTNAPRRFILYQQESDALPLQRWLQDEGRLRQALQQTLEHVAGDMAKDLHPPPEEPEAGGSR